MLLIPCPWCGPRSEHEFGFGGEPAVRPQSSASDTEWADYLYMRTNPKGRNTELWCHSAGCGQWFVMERDTVTHAIHTTREMGA